MAAEKPTPEERLFAIIRGATHPPLRRAESPGARPWDGLLTALRGPWNLSRVNRLLTTLVVLLGAGTIGSWFVRPSTDRFVATAEAQAAATPLTLTPPPSGPPPTEAFVARMQARDPFKLEPPPPPPEPAAPPTPPPPPPPPPIDQQALDDLRLVGISWDPEPLAMIEQVKTQQTHFLRVGDPIGPFRVQSILANHVILRQGEQTVELF